MHCHHCDTLMEQTDSLQELGTRQTWFRCPLCGAEHTVVEPAPSACQRLGNRLRWGTTQPAPAGPHPAVSTATRHKFQYRKA